MPKTNKSKSNTYIIYWAKHSYHFDPSSEGYVGLTSKSLSDRKTAHFKTAKSSTRTSVHFHNVLKKYQDSVLWIVLHDNLSEEEAYLKEAEYRPEIKIGWNSDRGGLRAVSPEWYNDPTNKKAHSLKTSKATKQKIAEKDTPEARALRAKEIWNKDGYRESREGLMAGVNNPQFGKFGVNHPGFGHIKTEAGRKSISKSQRGKVVSQETRDKLAATRVAMFADQKAARLERLKRERQNKREQQAKDKVDGKFKGEAARASKVTDLQRSEICQRRQNGEPYKAIADKYPISLTGVRAICLDWGPINGYPFERKIGKSDLKKVISSEDKTAICKEYSEGISAQKLATKFGVSFQTVYNFLANWGPKHDIPYVKKK